MKSVMQHQFSQIPKVEIQRSVFDRSHGYKTTFDEDYLIPFYFDEVLPGDTFRCKATLFARLMAQIVPIMDNLYMDTFYFFVPNRLVWDKWQQFCGEQPSPDDTFSFDTPIPTLECVTIVAETLNDYFGLPIGASIAPDCLFHRAYNLIWNEWFRDQNLQDAVPDNSASDGPDDPADYVLLKRGKRHDYFTSCLPWPQKGPGVELPLGTSAPVIGNGMSIGFWTGQGSGARYGGMFDEGSGALTFDKNLYGEAAGHAASAAPADVTDVGLGLTTTGSASGMIADLSNATAATINSLRQAFQIQKTIRA